MKNPSNKQKKILNFSGTIVLCVVLVFIVSRLRPDKRVETKESTKSMGMPVSILEVNPQAYAAVVTALGEVVPTWDATLRAQIDGRVAYISSELRTGSLVKKGDVLLRIERSAYELQVAEANNKLASAQTELMLEERRVFEAEQNWKRSGMGGDPDSPLALRVPQLTVARSATEAAKAALAYAEIQLDWTEICAPFDSVVTMRNVDWGESLFIGDEVCSLYGLETVEAGIQLDTTQWALLSKPLVGSTAKLKDPRSESSWKATVVRESRRLDRDSRLRTLFLQIERPLDQNPPLLPGTFVRAELTGRAISGLLQIPESALTKAGKVWFVDADNRLVPQRTEPIFRGEGTVFIHALERGMQRVARAPNSSFISGLLVQPVNNGQGE